MKYWLLPDTHFGHDNMIEYENRPQDFSGRILTNVVRYVSKDDVIIHLGDFCIGNDNRWHMMFNVNVPRGTKKWLIRGNHDKKSNSWYMEHGWDMVCTSLGMHTFGKKILLTHERQLALIDYDINIHGHSHSKGISDSNHIALAIERMHYTPVRLRTVVEKGLK